MLLTLLVTTATAAAQQQQPPQEYRHAFRIQEQYTRSLYEEPGVNGVHIIRCEPKTGERVPTNKGEWCLLITTNTQDQAAKLQYKFRYTNRLDGMFVATKAIGAQRPQ